MLHPSQLSNTSDYRNQFSDTFCRVGDEVSSFKLENCNEFFFYDIDTNVREESFTPEIISGKYHVILIPGIFGECVIKEVSPFQFAIPQVVTRLKNVRFTTLTTISGRASSSYNAEIINNELSKIESEPGESIIVIGYSKGTTDFLHYIKEFYSSENKRLKIDAFVSISGVVNGTQLGDATGAIGRTITSLLPLSDCPTKDESGLKSMSLNYQFKWLGDNTHIFSQIPMYSVITISRKEKLSRIFYPFYSFLYRTGGVNDGQVNGANQVLPRSKILAYLNSDHWAVILPFSKLPASELGALNTALKELANKNEFPQEVLLESIIRVVDSDLNLPR